MALIYNGQDADAYYRKAEVEVASMILLLYIVVVFVCLYSLTF